MRHRTDLLGTRPQVELRDPTAAMLCLRSNRVRGERPAGGGEVRVPVLVEVADRDVIAAVREVVDESAGREAGDLPLDLDGELTCDWGEGDVW